MATSTWLPQSPGQDLGERDRTPSEPSPRTGALATLLPEEGWTSIPLVLLLAFTMAWSVADARWILGRDELSSYLIWVGLAAALWGYVSARLNVSPWLAHTLGAAIGALVIIEVVGSALPGAAPGPVGWFNATAISVTQAYLDLTWRHHITTTQYGHYGLVLGILIWGTAQAASYDIFGHHRAVNGVLLFAVVLIANMALTLHDQYAALVLFSAAAMLLLIQAHAAEERSSWLRHRIWRGRDFKAPHLQGGVAFASLAICGSLILTSVASSAPLSGPMSDLSGNFRDFGTWISAYLPNNGQSRFQGTADFQSTSAISGSFAAPSSNVFTVVVPAGVSFHWRMVSYDQFQSTGWGQSKTRQDSIDAGKPLGAGTLDEVGQDASGRIEVRYTVHVQDQSISHMVVANEPDTADVQAARTLVVGENDSDVAWLSTGATDYTLTSRVPDLEVSGGLTEWRLQHAGTDFPGGLLARYTQGADLVGQDAENLLDEISRWAKAHNLAFDTEYDMAKQIQNYLRGPDGGFVYNSNILDIVAKCTGLSTVDCFAKYREGFCQQYATTMTMLMRMGHFPARYVLGYLPGRTDPHSLIQQVTRQQQHAWVEVYFPSYGWVPFDPTGGSVGVPTVLPAGSAETASPKPSLTTLPSSGHRTLRPDEGGGTGQVAGTGGGDNGAGMLIAAILVAVLALALLVLWRRRPRRLEGADSVYRSVVRLASRLGYRPAPTQTVYEYTGMLAERLPKARESLGVVATATVEVTYGRRSLGVDRLRALSAAHVRIRRALLRLVFRLPHRRKNGRHARGPRN